MAGAHPSLSEREKRLVDLLVVDGAREGLSYADIAMLLNNAYRVDNQGCRTRDGIYQYIRQKKINTD
jgi:hypothetical protein